MITRFFILPQSDINIYPWCCKFFRYLFPKLPNEMRHCLQVDSTIARFDRKVHLCYYDHCAVCMLWLYHFGFNHLFQDLKLSYMFLGEKGVNPQHSVTGLSIYGTLKWILIFEFSTNFDGFLQLKLPILWILCNFSYKNGQNADC